MKKEMLAGFGITCLSLGGMANAALLDCGVDSLGNHFIYDTDLNITWYDFTGHDHRLSHSNL